MIQSRIIFGFIIMLLGVSIIFEIPFFKYGIALLIIWVGLNLLTSGSGQQNKNKAENDENEIDRVLIFSGINQKVISSDFRGVNLVVVFGGGELDLSEVKTKKKELSIETVVIFGGLKVRMPNDWQVQSEGIGVLGEFSNKTKSNSSKSKLVQAKAQGVAILGSVELVN